MKDTFITIACNLCPFLLLSKKCCAIFCLKIRTWVKSPVKAVLTYLLLPISALYIAFLADEKGCLINWGILTALGSIIALAIGFGSIETAGGFWGVVLCILGIAFGIFLGYVNITSNAKRAGWGYAAVSYILQIAIPYLLLIVAAIYIFTMMGLVGTKTYSDPFDGRW